MWLKSIHTLIEVDSTKFWLTLWYFIAFNISIALFSNYLWLSTKSAIENSLKLNWIDTHSLFTFVIMIVKNKTNKTIKEINTILVGTLVSIKTNSSKQSKIMIKVKKRSKLYPIFY